MSSERLDILVHRPIVDLIADPLTTDHEWFRGELDRLVELAACVSSGHGEHQDFLADLEDGLTQLREVMLSYIESEELVVFPLLNSGQATQAQDAIRGLELEDLDVERVLAQLHRLTQDLRTPAGAGADWRELYESIAAFEARKRLHKRIESEILFPRVLYADTEVDPSDRAKEKE